MKKEAFENIDFYAKEPIAQKSSLQELGLLQGLTGISLIYNLIGKHRNDAACEQTGSELLEEITQNSHLIEGISFGHGLTGLGWTIEWLAQNSYIEGFNTDAILESLDMELYKVISFSKGKTLSLYEGLTGNVAYFEKRCGSENFNVHRYKRIGNLECLIILTDDLAEAILDHKEGRKQHLINIAELGIVLTTIASMRADVNKPVLESIIYNAVSCCENILDQLIHSKSTERSRDNIFDSLYLSVSYLIAAKKKKHEYWQARAISYIEKLLALIPADLSGDTDLHFKKLIVFSLIHLHLPGKDFKTETLRLITLLTPRDLPVCILNGRGTLALAELCLENVSLMEDWQQLFFY